METLTTSKQKEGLQLHAVMVPFPAQGHISPHVQLARRLSRSHGFHITFVNTLHNHNRLMQAQAAQGGSEAKSDARIHFVGLPDGLPEDHPRTADINGLFVGLEAFSPVVHEFLEKLIVHSPVACLIRDVAMTCVHQAAKTLGIPIVAFVTQSAVAMYAHRHIPKLIAEGLLPLPAPSVSESYESSLSPLDQSVRPPLSIEESEARARMVTCLPGLSPVTRVDDLPSFYLTHDFSLYVIQFAIKLQAPLMHDCAWVLFNTFQELEAPALETMREEGLNVGTVGPLCLLPTSSNGDASSALWPENRECLQWLDRKEPSSVLFISFGSIAVLSAEQIKELVSGLQMSQRPFLWAFRPDLIVGGQDTKFLTFFSEFVESTKDLGLILPWVPQTAVLSHPSMSVFLTHCGWNSVLESISSGVPMLAWPYFAEQAMNCRYIAHVWKIGLDFEKGKDGLVGREEVKEKVMVMMGGEDEEIAMLRKRVRLLRDAATKAVLEGGSSHEDLQTFVGDMEKRVKGSVHTKPTIITS